jgi:hypothetical protein
MDSTVLVALIALAGTIVSGVISAIISGRLTNYRLEMLEKKVDKHNNLVERMFKVEEDISLLRKDIDQIKEEK